MIQPRIPVIPSGARNLKSIIARPDTRCRASIVTKCDQEQKRRKTPLCQRYVRTDTLDSSTPLRSAQNDSAGVAFWSMESGAIGKYLPLLARRGRDTERGTPFYSASTKWQATQ